MNDDARCKLVESLLRTWRGVAGHRIFVFVERIHLDLDAAFFFFSASDGERGQPEMSAAATSGNRIS